MRNVVTIVLLASFCTGCFTIKYVAPVGSEVSTLTEREPASFKKEFKVWYALWGLVTITDNSTDQIIAQNNLKEVRATSKISFVDFVISIFTGIATIVPHTVVVEGNP